MTVRETARVCVDGGRKCGAVAVENTESHDGAATPPRGRVLCTRRDRYTTTTYYTLGLVSSSIGRECTLSIHPDTGGVDV